MWKKRWKTSDFYTSKEKKNGNECLKALLFQHKSGNPVCLIPVQREMDHVG